MKAGGSSATNSTMAASPAPRWSAPPCRRCWMRSAAGKIDIIVVYKVDRLTRSLADFAKLVELFDEHGVSFVSVTQSFNTTSSMGRLTLNVLLSFAQFEREVIGERVRDKIAASKRKGIWVGGPVPLGYRSVGKKLEVVPEEAALVRKIYRGLSAARLDRRAGGRARRGRRQAKTPVARQWDDHRGPALHGRTAGAYLEEPILYRRGRLSRRNPSRASTSRSSIGSCSTLSRRDSPSAPCGESCALAVAFLADGTDLRRSRQSHEPEPRQQEGRALSLLCLAGTAAEPQIRGRVGLARIRTGHRKYRRRGPSPGDRRSQRCGRRSRWRSTRRRERTGSNDNKDDQLDSRGRIAGQRPRPDRASRRAHRPAPARDRNRHERQAGRARRCVASHGGRRTALS